MIIIKTSQENQLKWLKKEEAKMMISMLNNDQIQKFTSQTSPSFDEHRYLISTPLDTLCPTTATSATQVTSLIPCLFQIQTGTCLRVARNTRITSSANCTTTFSQPNRHIFERRKKTTSNSSRTNFSRSKKYRRVRKRRENDTSGTWRNSREVFLAANMILTPIWRGISPLDEEEGRYTKKVIGCKFMLSTCTYA